jgi:hypothetical protein
MWFRIKKRTDAFKNWERPGVLTKIGKDLNSVKMSKKPGFVGEKNKYLDINRTV